MFLLRCSACAEGFDETRSLSATKSFLSTHLHSHKKTVVFAGEPFRVSREVVDV